MPRDRIAKFFATAVLVFTSAATSASDFWVAKDWHQWSKDECSKILIESPWAHVTRPQDESQPTAGHSPGQPHLNPAPLANSQGEAVPPNPTGTIYDAYAVQLRSALPIREAIVRLLEIAQQYDNKTTDQRKVFDDAAGKILTTSYDKTILVRLYFSKGALGLRPDQIKNLQPTLVTEDGQQITPTQVDSDPMTPYAVDLYFPRSTNGARAIKSTQKQFAFQFQTPHSSTPKV